jgi:2-polyprenyl-3-methyl-5-hydroxy-6-metoxy-1,4-benzoquinol methylase
MSENHTLLEREQLNKTQQYWNNAAATFDEEPDHGLRDAGVRQAWLDLIGAWLPSERAPILDIGCGTGSLSILLADLGHVVTGIDLAPAMIAQAKRKAEAAGRQIAFAVMDAREPRLAPQRFKLILCRHLLWMLSDPKLVLQRWVDLLAPGGRLLLIEGYWHTGGGLHAQEVVAALPDRLRNVTVQMLSDRPTLWGGEVTDERYAVIADMPK